MPPRNPLISLSLPKIADFRIGNAIVSLICFRMGTIYFSSEAAILFLHFVKKPDTEIKSYTNIPACNLKSSLNILVLRTDLISSHLFKFIWHTSCSNINQYSM